jgi:hypothetical protein
MQLVYLSITMIFLVGAVAALLISINAHMMKIGKNESLQKQNIKEDDQWEFIKGLY